MKLHLGCGRTILDGWVNVDNMHYPDVVRYNLDGAAQKPMPWRDNSVDTVYGSHVIEHLRNPLPMMQELHRVCEPGATAVFECPYGATDDADEDPTHVRRMFPGSFAYFAQPTYWRADYGYRGDWRVALIELEVAGGALQSLGEKGMVQRITHGRNIVLQMRAYLECVKPIRPPDKELMDGLPVQLVPVRVDGLSVDDGIDRLSGPHLRPDQLPDEGDDGGDDRQHESTEVVVDDPGADEQGEDSGNQTEG